MTEEDKVKHNYYDCGYNKGIRDSIKVIKALYMFLDSAYDGDPSLFGIDGLREYTLDQIKRSISVMDRNIVPYTKMEEVDEDGK
jgi:hypothetical protein